MKLFVPAVKHSHLTHVEGFEGISHVEEDLAKTGAAGRSQVHFSKGRGKKSGNYQQQTCRQDLWPLLVVRSYDFNFGNETCVETENHVSIPNFVNQV